MNTGPVDIDAEPGFNVSTGVIRTDRSIDRGAEDLTACLVVLAGTECGRVYELGKDSVIIGRDEGCDVAVSDDAISRHQAQIERQDKGDFHLVDLESTNGTFCNGERITDVQLTDGDKIMVGTSTILKFCFQDAIERQFSEHQFASAITDWLTKVYNRRYFDNHLEQEHKSALRHGTPLSLLMIDIDHFKRVNDEHGHVTGDVVLQGVAAAIGKVMRTEEILSRFGGEEFAILARNTAAAGALSLAERCRAAVAAASFTADDVVVSVTVSIGIASCNLNNPDSATALVANADQALYKAKENGRDRVEVFEQ